MAQYRAEVEGKQMQFELTGRWDELEDIDTVEKLQGYLVEIDNIEALDTLKVMFTPLNLSGTYTIRGIDTAANTYPMPDEVAFDKSGNPGTVEVTPNMTPFDIMVAVVAWADAQFEGFPHHHWFEVLDIDPVGKTLSFHMGS